MKKVVKFEELEIVRTLIDQQSYMLKFNVFAVKLTDTFVYLWI